MVGIRARVLGVELVWLFLLLFLFSHVVAQSVDDSPTPSASFSIISPLAGEVVSNKVIIFLKVDDASDGKASVSFSSSPENELLSLNAENGWMAELNVNALDDGIHSLDVTLCTITCETKTVEVVVEKTGDSTPVQPPADGGEVPDEKWVSLFPSNWAGAFVLTSEENSEQTFSSSGDAWKILAGRYSANLTFFDFPFSQWSFSSADVQADSTLVSLHELENTPLISVDGADRTPVSMFRVSFGVPFSTATFSLSDSSLSDVARCDAFDERSNACSGEWSLVNFSNDTFDVPYSPAPLALAILSHPSVPISHTISFSSLPGTFHLFSAAKGKEGPFSSDPISIEEGVYTINGSWEDFPLVSAQLTDVSLNADGTIFDFETQGLDNHSILLAYALPFSFDYSSFRLSPAYNAVYACDDSSLSACDNPVALNSFSFPSSSGKLLVTFEKPLPPLADENGSLRVSSELGESIAWLKSLRQNMHYFSATDSLLTYPALGQLFTKIEIGLECAPRADPSTITSADVLAESANASVESVSPESKPVLEIPPFEDYSNAWENSPALNVSESSEETPLECDGVSLQNSFTAISALRDYENTVFVGAAPAVKHLVSLRNDTPNTQVRNVGWRMILSGERVDSAMETLSPSPEYVLISPEKKYLDDSNTMLAQVENAVLRFAPSANEPYFGSYNFSDLVYAGYDPRVLVHKRNGVTVVDTILRVSLSPFEQLDLDPTVVLNSSSNYSAMYAGGSNSDFLGRTFARSLSVIGDTNFDQNVPLYNAVQVLNMDNDAYANDLFIPAAFADINSKTNAGALYIIQDADTKFGDKYVVNSNSYTFRYSGSSANDLLTFPGQPTPGYYLKDTDGNGYTNDLLILAPQADYTAFNAGTLYYIRDIDTKAAGNYDLNNSTFFAARYDGWKANDYLGDSFDSGEAVRVGNFDGNNMDNDLVISIPRSDSLTTDNGLIAVYKDFNKFSGIRTVNITTPGWYVRGGVSWTTDFIAGKTLGPPGFQILNLDGNSFSNDLAILVPTGGYDDCDTVSNPNWGFVYIYKDFTRRPTSGNLDSLCGIPGSAATADYFFYDTGAATNFGRTGDRNNSFTTWDVNGNGILSDVLFFTPSYSTNAGSVWFNKSLYRQNPSSFVSASVTLNFSGAANEWLGFTDDSGPAVQMVNVDANRSSNDMLVNCPLCDGSNFISRTNSGNISITHDLNRIVSAVSTSHRIMNTGSVNRLRGSRYIGSRAGDQIGDTNGSGDGVFLKDMDGDGTVADLFIAGSSIDAPATDTGAVYWIQDANDFVTGGGEFSASGFYLYEFDLNKDTNYTARWSTPTAYDRLGDTNRSHDSAPKVVNIDNGYAANDLIMVGSYIDVNSKTNAGALYIVKDANTKSGNIDLSNSANYSVMFNGAASNEYLGLNVYGGKGYQIVNIDGNSYANDLLISAARVSDNGSMTGALYVIVDVDTKSGALDLNNSDNYYKKYVGGAASDQLTSTLHSGEGAQLVNLDNNSYANDLLLVSVQADVNSVTDAGAVYWMQDIYTLSGGGGGPPVNDYSFVVSLPSSGCTNGKGRISSGSGACEKGYFIPTDLSGFSDENQVNPEGQNSSQPFFVYDNQSSSSSDLNILFDLNSSLPAAIQVKVSKTYAGYAGSCTGNTDTNCLLVSTTATNIGKATYSAGTQDLNIFIWTDFVSADVAQYDRNVDSNSVAST